MIQSTNDMHDEFASRLTVAVVLGHNNTTIKKNRKSHMLSSDSLLILPLSESHSSKLV